MATTLRIAASEDDTPASFSRVPKGVQLMAKKGKMTTNEALEWLLGKKAARRLRQLATQLASEDRKARRRQKKVEP
jgi:hypothetical protein